MGASVVADILDEIENLWRFMRPQLIKLLTSKATSALQIKRTLLKNGITRLVT